MQSSNSTIDDIIDRNSVKKIVLKKNKTETKP